MRLNRPIFAASVLLVLTLSVPSQAQQQKVRPYLRPQETAVRVTGLLPGSPAARAGLEVGDIIVQVDGVRIHNLRDLATALRSENWWVTLRTLDRYGDRPQYHYVYRAPFGRIGIDAEEVPLRREQNGFGIRITRVWPGRPAARAGLEVDDVILRVNGNRIDSLPELSRSLRRAAGAAARMTVINHRNGQRTRVYVYPLPNGAIGIDGEPVARTGRGNAPPY